SSRRRHTRSDRDWSSDVCSSDLAVLSYVNVESLARRIERHEVHVAQGYGAWTQELANPASETWAFGPSAVFLIVDGAELFRGQRDRKSVVEGKGRGVGARLRISI